MFEELTFAAQLSLLRREADYVQHTLRGLANEANGVYERVRPHFDIEFERLGRALEKAQTQAEGGGTVRAWASLADARRLVRPLARECLGLMQAARLDPEDEAAAVCAIADKLLADLSDGAQLGWRSFTVVAESAFTGEFAQIIRLAFPELSIWDLPIAAHEFGHFAGPEIRAPADGPTGDYVQPFRDLLKAAWAAEDVKRWHHLHEHCADIFAVHALGPAFPLTCLLLRFEPRKPRAERGWHPSASDRAYVMLKTLSSVNDEFAFQPFSQILQKLKVIWTESMAAAGTSTPVDTKRQDGLDETFDLIYPLIRDQLATIRYSTFSKAQQLTDELAAPGGDVSLPEGTSIGDVINAAWLCRLDRGVADQAAADAVGKQALALCRELANA